jgi:hypothetical protein
MMRSRPAKGARRAALKFARVALSDSAPRMALVLRLSWAHRSINKELGQKKDNKPATKAGQVQFFRWPRRSTMSEGSKNCVAGVRCGGSHRRGISGDRV